MVRQQIELDFPHPNPVKDNVVLKLECDVEENCGFDDFSISKMSNIEIKIDGIFCKRIYADWKWFLHHLLDAVTVREDLVDADGK
jgi:hypothetical protein